MRNNIIFQLWYECSDANEFQSETYTIFEKNGKDEFTFDELFKIKTHRDDQNEINELLPTNSHLVLNNAKVIPARLNFYRATGSKIEVFLLVQKMLDYMGKFLILNSCFWLILFWFLANIDIFSM